MIQFSNEVIGEYFKTRSYLSIVKYATNWKKGADVKIEVVPMLKEYIVQATTPNTELNTKILNIFPDSIFSSLIEQSDDYKVIWCLGWIKKNIKYKSDKLIWKVDEYWQSPLETLQLKTGDCEDGAILLYVLCRFLGVSENKLKILCGTVTGGGHCFCAYTPSSYPWMFVFLDWCYNPNLNSIEDRPMFFINSNKIAGQDKAYQKMWFGFNEVDSYYEFNTL